MESDTVFDPINRQFLLKLCRKVFEKLTDNGELPIESYLKLIKYFYLLSLISIPLNETALNGIKDILMQCLYSSGNP